MRCPARGGSDYFNYKKTHSIVLMGVCNGSYEFIMVDIGDDGRQSDGRMYSNSNLGFAILVERTNLAAQRMPRTNFDRKKVFARNISTNIKNIQKWL